MFFIILMDSYKHGDDGELANVFSGNCRYLISNVYVVLLCRKLVRIPWTWSSHCLCSIRVSLKKSLLKTTDVRGPRTVAGKGSHFGSLYLDPSHCIFNRQEIIWCTSRTWNSARVETVSCNPTVSENIASTSSACVCRMSEKRTTDHNLLL